MDAQLSSPPFPDLNDRRVAVLPDTRARARPLACDGLSTEARSRRLARPNQLPGDREAAGIVAHRRRRRAGREQRRAEAEAVGAGKGAMLSGLMPPTGSSSVSFGTTPARP